jgi:hypothetical protein
MKAIFAVIMAAYLLALITEAKDSRSAAISVRIDANDDEVGNLAKSYISRELRSLGDVTLDAPQPTFVIHCKCFTLELKNGVKSGYVVGFVITSNLDTLKYIAGNEQIAGALDKLPEAEILRWALEGLCRTMQEYEGQLLYLCPMDGLKDQCASFVATFDTQFLEPLRQKHQ